jgi:hypothetical protein
MIQCICRRLSVLDDQITGMQDKMQQISGDLGVWRHESVQRSLDFDRLRQDMESVKNNHEALLAEHKQQVHAMQVAASSYEIAIADKETRAALQLQDYARAEADIQELRTVLEARLSALEKSWRREMPKASSAASAEGKVKDLEFEVGCPLLVGNGCSQTIAAS